MSATTAPTPVPATIADAVGLIQRHVKHDMARRLMLDRCQAAGRAATASGRSYVAAFCATAYALVVG